MPLPTIAFSSWAFPGEPVDRGIDHALRHGFRALEIALLDPALFDGLLPSDDQARAVAARTADLRLSVHAPIDQICLADPDPEIRAASADCLRRTIAAAHHMGARVVVFHLIRGTRDELPLSADESGRAFAADLIRPLGEEAAAAGVTLAVENIGISSRAADRDYTGLCDLVDTIGLDNVGIALDIGHAHVHDHNGGGLAAAAGLFGSRVCHYHVHDNDGTADQHLRVGGGTVDYAPLLDRWQTDFSGILAMEIFPFVETDLKEAISASQSALTELLTGPVGRPTVG
ncbi:sugar phosphate isomerase/epimerase family protein [Actinomadura fulvescens]|uniref:Xylose isomerase-like TIM barrel domain-containing protein n=1 Tax=Actinomadura fulvescens TaxID=46160 RepID=A0ABP6C0M6_9ACTN